MKKKAVKIAISLPAELLEAAEQARKARGESRSQFFQQAVETFLRRTREQEAIERYVQGYREIPETEEEVAAIHQASSAILSQESWE
jgi:metal-responsive CopG/Arc/MetJ family transcriptional regulator